MNHATSTKMAKTKAALVHIFTASGMIAALMAFMAIIDGAPGQALLWLCLSLVIDTVDGPMARHFHVKTHLPEVDGAILDHVIDYTTYAVIPALFISRFDILPGGWGLPGAGLIMVTSLYCFSNTAMKTDDNFFSGFPAIWNLVVIYFYIFATPPVLAAAIVGAGVVLTFVPVKCIHPFRVQNLRAVTMALTFVWSALILGLLFLKAGLGLQGLESYSPMMTGALGAVSLYFIAVSALRTLHIKFKG